MATIIKDFEEYENMYQRIISTIRFDQALVGNLFLYTSPKIPLSYEDAYPSLGNQLFINPKYYRHHKKEIQELVVATVKSTTQDTMNIFASELVTSEVVDAIVKNANLKIVTLPRDEYISKEDRTRILDSGVHRLNCAVDFEKEEDTLYEYIPGLTITNYPSVGKATVEGFATDKVYLSINEPLSNKQLALLRKLFEKYPQQKVLIDFASKEQLKEVLDTVKAEHILFPKMSNFTKEDCHFLEQHYDNVSFQVGFRATATPKQIREKEEILDTITKEAKEKDLSPLEEYMYLYNVTKLFKTYKEVPKDLPSMHSRQSEFTLFNEYMVCVGYADLLEKLVKRLNNPNVSTVEYSCSVQDGNKSVGHSRCLTRIKDEKYGVDGIYISDPTWDCVRYYERYRDKEGVIQEDENKPTADIDLYNHFLMTKKEMVDENENYSSPDITDVLFEKYTPFDKSEISDFNYRIAEIAVEDLMHLSLSEMSDEQIKKIMERIGNKQSPISKEILESAITNLYSKIYVSNEEKIAGLVETTLSHNDKRQKKNFRNTRYKFSDSIQPSSGVVFTSPPTFVFQTPDISVMTESVIPKETHKRSK